MNLVDGDSIGTGSRADQELRHGFRVAVNSLGIVAAPPTHRVVARRLCAARSY